MKRGFTLIELLAVIVILAIIALIATPIILNIINDARESANEESVELYAAAIEQAVAKYQVNNPNGELNSATIFSSVQYNGQEINCATKELYSDGKIYLAGCTVGTDTKEYTYGTKQQSESYEAGPDFYSWASSGSVGGNLPDDKKTKASELTTNPGRDFYIGLDTEDGTTVSAAYVCFVTDKEYCLKGGVAEELREEAFISNQGILDEAFADVENACSLDDGAYHCNGIELFAVANSNSSVHVEDEVVSCFVNSDGKFGCLEN